MRVLVVLLIAAAVVGCGQKHDDHAAKGEKPHDAAGDHTHGGDEHAGHKAALTALDLQTRDGLKAGTAAKLRFTIPDASGKPVKTFAVAHDAKVHFILIRQGLDTFARLHPEVDPATGTLTGEYTFPKGGVYHLFADYQEPVGMPMTATAHVEVGGDAAPAAPPLKPDVPGRIQADPVKGVDMSAKIAVENAKDGETTVRFDLIDLYGKPVGNLQSYMGAMGHLVVVSADATRYVHAHPAEGQTGAKNVVAFGATFPQAGLYKGWGQFKRDGFVQVIPFVVNVP